MSDFYTVLTTDGMAEILDCVANNRGFKPATMAVGDSNGSYYEPEKTQIALKNPLYTGNIYAQGKKSSSEKSAGYLYFCFQVPPSVGNFVIREVGLFSPEGKLWAVAKYPETLKTKADETSDKTLNIEIQIELSDLILNTIVIDNSGNLVTRQTLEEYQPLEEKGKAEGYAPLDNEAKVPLEHLRGVFTTFCFNSGAVDKMGKPTLLEYKEELVSSADIADPENIVTVTRKIITLKAPATYTDGNGKTIVISEDLTLDVTDFEPGAKYSLRVVENNGVMDFFAVKGAEVYRQKAEPENPNPGDLWQNMSVAPELAYIRTTDDTWQITNEVEAGVYTVPAEGQELGGGGEISDEPVQSPYSSLEKAFR